MIIVRPKMVEMTAFGAALAAGFAVGVWNMRNVKPDYDLVSPSITQEGKHSSYFNFIS